ncbi:T9SS type A sorting domain-containing protein [Bacteroidota bacterium]
MKTIYFKKRIRLSSSILLAALIIGGGFLLIPVNKDIRLDYENFILSEYEKTPFLTQEELKDIPKPERPDLARMRDHIMTMDPELKAVPSYRAREAYLKTRSIQNEQRLKSNAINIQWKEEAADMGGRTRTIMFDPNDAENKKVWAGAVTGGLWVNNNAFGSDSWTAVSDLWSNLAISCMTYDPNNTQVFYLGTGESQTATVLYRESSGRGSGLMRSIDGGESWNFLESTLDWAYVSDVIVRDENGHSVIYAAVLSGKYHGNHQSQPSDGLYRSENGGESWTQVLPNIQGKDVPYAPSDIEMVSDGSRIFVGTTYNLNNDGASCILYSDDGINWNIFSDYRSIILNSSEENIPGRVVITSAPSNPNILIAGFAAAEQGRTGGFIGYNCPYILKSIDKGTSWSPINLPDNDSGWAYIAWHAMVLAFQPDNPDIMWAGGLDLFRSTNGGESWTKYTNWAGMYGSGSPTYVHADQHRITYQPGSSKKMLFGTDGGVFATSDGTAPTPEFFERNVGYNTLQYYSCAIHPEAGAEHYIGGLQDNGSMYYSGETITFRDMLSGGDGALCWIDQDDPLYMITSVYFNSYKLYVAPVSGAPSSRGGKNTNDGTFINPADYDSKMNILFANARGNNSTDKTDQLLKIKSFLTTRSTFYVTLNTGTTVPYSCIKVSPYAPDHSSTIFIGTQAGKLFKVENADLASPIVTEIGGVNFPVGYISAIDVGQSENTIVVTFSNYGVTSVFFTSDGGANWFPKEGNLPDMPVRSVIFHPENDNQVMIATDLGIWITSNIKIEDHAWVPSVDVLPYVRIDEIKIRKSDNTVLAGTHGRGLFTGVWPKDSSSDIENNIISEIDLKVFPNPADQYVNLQVKIQKNENILISVLDISGRVLVEEKEENISGKYSKQIDVSRLPTGTYFLRLVAGNDSETKKIIIK